MPQTQADSLRSTIERFLGERFSAKTEKLSPDDPQHQKLTEQFNYDTWLANAAQRVSQLQVVTHSLKPVHPDAKGSSLYAPPASDTPSQTIGTHALGDAFTVDVVGNAAALDVFKFLKLEHDGQTLLERVEQGDAQLAAALSDDADTGAKLMRDFATITEPSGEWSSHKRGKQLYWLVGDDPSLDDAFHLISPLYATSLAHRVFRTINDDRFSDNAKAAREARKKDHPDDHGFVDYPGLAVQRFGGSKPQNISQLNSERGGNSYLLSCAPPTWRSRHIAPIRGSSAFTVFGRRPDVRRNVRSLGRLLAGNPEPNMGTRDRRDELTRALVDELIVFTSEMQQLPPGWTDDWHCRLAFAHQCWLDPFRATEDADFRAEMADIDWLSTVCEDFSRWLNGRLEYFWKLAMGDPEHRHFAKSAARDENMATLAAAYRDWQYELQAELAGFAEVIDDDE
ncbi:type I-F CRISPR-associated protein Csy1 [uncultured Salinisphaera sp.]|uniref:type I-F CRISPR-associated protein Csy1 n=1 Tax=uncultured Salinisphaera sp. TaxID=359372 RepID=UPI0032B27482|tara:strand:- start:3706 stop:5064 length:1359 start_codon:yes stop_codon:yes gene_type:complete